MKKRVLAWFPNTLTKAALASASIWLAQPPKAAAETVIAEYDGDGAGATRPFHAEGPWELQWRGSQGPFGGNMFFAWSVPGDQTPDHYDLLAGSGGGTNDPDPHGSSYHAKGGDFYIFVQSTGPWHVRIVLLAR